MGIEVSGLYKMYKNIGIKEVIIKLYENARHEIVNELNKADVYDDVSEWLDSIANAQENKNIEED